MVEEAVAPWQRLLGDPLREVTRKERRALLGVSVVALALTEAAIIPGKVQAFGVEIQASDKHVQLLILGGIVLYFLMAFAIYAVSDFIVWQRSYFELIDKIEFEQAKERFLAEEAGSRNEVFDIQAVDMRKERWRSTLRRAIGPMSVIRTVFEFLAPVVVGTGALIRLLVAAA